MFKIFPFLFSVAMTKVEAVYLKENAVINLFLLPA